MSDAPPARGFFPPEPDDPSPGGQPGTGPGSVTFATAGKAPKHTHNNKQHHVPRKTGDFGMILFLASLAILFAASMLAFIIVRFMQSRPRTNLLTDEVYPALTPMGSLHLPATLWLSTIIILASSVTMHFALKNVRLERQQKFCRWMVVTAVLAGLFLIVQVPGLIALLIEHNRLEVSHAMFGAIFFLVLVHALHLVGGIVPLIYVTRKAFHGAYDHESHAPVKHLTMYWHFLDAVWLVMFTLLLVLR